MSKNLETINAKQFNELAKSGQIAKLRTSIEPYYTTPTADTASSHKAVFYYYNGKIYTNIKDAKTGSNEKSEFKLSLVKSINLQSDPSNKDICTVHLSYLENNIETYESFLNMTNDSAEQLVNELAKSKINLTLKKDAEVLKKAKTEINWAAYNIDPSKTTATTTRTPGFKATSAAPRAAAARVQGQPQVKKELTPTPRRANKKNQGIYVAKGADLFLTEEERKAFYSPAPTIRSGRTTSPNRVAAEQEMPGAPQPSEKPAETKKKTKKEPLRKRIAKKLFGPKEEKSKGKEGLWKSGLKDITTAGVRLGSAALVILSVAGAFIPFVGIAMFIAGVVGLVATDAVIDFAEDTVKNMAKGASAGIEKSKAKKLAKEAKKAQRALERENQRTPEQVEEHEIEEIRNEINTPSKHEEPQVHTTKKDSEAFFEDILGPTRTSESKYAGTATHADTAKSSVVRGRNGFDQITMPEKRVIKDSDSLASGHDEWVRNVTGFRTTSGAPTARVAGTTATQRKTPPQLKEKNNEDEKFKRQLGEKNKIDRDRTFGN